MPSSKLPRVEVNKLPKRVRSSGKLVDGFFCLFAKPIDFCDVSGWAKFELTINSQTGALLDFEKPKVCFVVCHQLG